MAPQQMKEAIVSKDGSVKIHTRDLPVPKAGQVLIKVVVAGTNPKDWKVPYLIPNVPSHNSGDDVAGTIEALGEGVLGFHVGDRVAAFHEMMAPDGAFAEYAIAWAATTFHIPEKTSYEEAATIPLAAMTAAVGLYLELGLPEPWKADEEKRPLIVYGGSGAVGAFCIKFAQASNVHPLIVVAGKGKDYVETLISREKGDTIIDYREGDEAVVSGIEKALKDAGCENCKYAYDAVSEHGSYQNVAKILTKNKSGSKMVLVLPGKDYSDIPSNVAHELSMVGRVHEAAKNKDLPVNAGKDFGFVFFHYITRGLQEGWFKGHPYEVIPGGLDGVQEGLKNLKEGKASAVKYVYRISETKDLGMSEEEYRIVSAQWQTRNDAVIESFTPEMMYLLNVREPAPPPVKVSQDGDTTARCSPWTEYDREPRYPEGAPHTIAKMAEIDEEMKRRDAKLEKERAQKK